MALTDWLFPELDQPAGGPAPANHTYTMTGRDGVVRVFHLTHAAKPAQVQEIINVVRTALDINRLFPVVGPGLLVVRGTADQVALAEWQVSQLDVSKPTPGAPEQARQLPGVRDPEIRLVHLAHPDSPVVGQLDQPAGQQGPAPHQQPLSEAHVFYLTHAGTRPRCREFIRARRRRQWRSEGRPARWNRRPP